MKAAYPIQSIVASSALALLTLTVFAVSQGRGPASAIQQYHKGLIERNAAVLDRVTTQPRSLAHSMLEAQVLQALSSAEEIDLGRVMTRGKKAIAQVVYVSPRYGMATITYAFQQDRAGWVIDPVETLSRTRESSRF